MEMPGRNATVSKPGTTTVPTVHGNTSESTSRTGTDLINAKFVREENINIGVEGDKWNRVAGMTNLGLSMLVMADYDTGRVSVLNIETKTVHARLNLSSKPWDVTAICDVQFAVTLPEEQTVQILAFQNDTLLKVRDFKVNGACRGIDYHGNRLAVSFVCPGKVEVMSTQGHVLQTFEKHADASPMFSDYPNYVIFTKNGETVQVSDYSGDTITRLSIAGHRPDVDVSVHKPTAIRGPLAMCLLEDGGCLVCEWLSNTIQMLSQDGVVIRQVLTNDDGMKSPKVVALSDNMEMLFVSSSWYTYIATYRLVYNT